MVRRKLCTVNYLDDYLFLAESEQICNAMVRQFLDLCNCINCPISKDKTEWATTSIVFLGILLNGTNRTLAVPQDKKEKAKNLLKIAILKRKVTIKFIQWLTGTLHFLNKAIVPGRAFTWKMYLKLRVTNSKGEKLRQYHHIYLDSDFISDCKVWLSFLDNNVSSKLCRPFLDWEDRRQTLKTFNFYSDASASHRKGMGAIFGDHYIICKWNSDFILRKKPSIEFLELYALVAAVLTWAPRLANLRVAIFCDNTAVHNMISATSSNCASCMNLIHILITETLKWNFRIFVIYVKSKDNVLADDLSRLKMKEFWLHAPPTMHRNPDVIPIWFGHAENYWKNS